MENLNEMKQIEEMAKVIDEYTEPLSARDIHKADFSEKFAEALYNANYRKQSEGRWIEESSLYVHCSICKTREYPREQIFRSKFCPECGASMKGGAGE